MRLAELYGARVRDRGGRDLGRVREVICDQGEVTHLGLGTGTLIERLTGGRRGRRMPWSAVIALKGGAIIVEP